MDQQYSIAQNSSFHPLGIELLKWLKKSLLEFKKNAKRGSCVIGFDGFTDDLVEAVATRHSQDEYVAMEKISQFAERIAHAAGVSCNIELVPLMRKIGGNAPIMANALLECGHCVSFIGAIGKDGIIEPLFQDMAKHCKKVISLAASGHSDAIEFTDGKVILGKHDSLVNINYETLLQHINKTELIQMLDTAELFVSANWTMLPLMNNIWKQLQSEILPFLSKKKEGGLRYLFVDLADPAKRLVSDIKEALEILSNWGPTHSVVLGLNAAESLDIANALGIETDSSTLPGALKAAEILRKRLSLHGLLIHTKKFAVFATEEDVYSQLSPHCEKPLITTGAGDNFNAGFCSGLLNNFPPAECLSLAIATAGFYIRKAKSPTIEDLIAFLEA